MTIRDFGNAVEWSVSGGDKVEVVKVYHCSRGNESIAIPECTHSLAMSYPLQAQAVKS